MRIIGLPGSGAWAYLARCALSRRPVPGFSLPEFPGPVVVSRASPEDLEDVADAFSALEPLFDIAPAALFGEDPQARLAALERVRAGARLVLATPEALAAPAPSRREFDDKTVRFKSRSTFGRSEAMARLEGAGYRRVDFVESPGEYAARGAVLDFFGLEPLAAVRVLYEEDLVESIRTFDPATQMTGSFLDEAKAVAAHAGGAGEPLSSWLSDGCLWLVEEGLKAPEGAAVFEAAEAGEGLDFGAKASRPGEPAWSEMRERAREGFKVLLYSINRGEDSRIQELVSEKLPEVPCQFLVGPLRQGFTHPGLKLHVTSTSEIFGRDYRPAGRWKYFAKTGRAGVRWSDLRAGDYVVHQDYGLARYQGLKPIESPGHGTLDCLALEFRGSDRLYVPMTEFGRVQKFSGAQGSRPRLSSLDTRTWEEIKAQVKEGVRELADMLLKIQAERAALPGHPFPPESAMEREFAEEFPFEETPDQARAIAEVLADMEAPHPMDRLVVGDVGFGKTEVAMRAAFKCVTGFKQAAVLVPTTILADQHFRTFGARFADYPVRAAMLSRFQTPGEQKKVLADLARGKIDVVVGTARLLQKDVRFKDLGLVVIDEEHRFGVKDKERFKQLRKSVDCLALSATPIPRTLHQAYSGLRGISLIESAPVGRQAIATSVLPWSEERVASAIFEELARGGQAYYVHNRVRSLPQTVERLKKLLPRARFAMVHGQMKGEEIEAAMWDFFNKKADVLVASTIIESGLDIPSVNTLLVEDAHEFGLAQLYQLRGRIGRERARAYCLLFYPSDREDLASLTEDARKRLEALKEFGELGSGFKLALRDLEIRGAGDLLGAKQHGFMNAVGVDFYTELLNEEIARRRGAGVAPQERPVSLDFKLSAFIPEDYLPGERERLEFYKRILRAKPAEVAELRRELEDLSGPVPPAVENLFQLLRLRSSAQKAKVRAVVQKSGAVEILFYPEAAITPDAVARWSKAYEGRLRFLHSEEGDGLSVETGTGSPARFIEEFLASFLGGPPKK